MKEKIELTGWAQKITEALPKGILLNTMGDKFNTMVIAWGGMGTCWGLPVFTVYVREHRYTKAQLDKTGEFTISVPVGGYDPQILKICGGRSGRDTDKIKEAGLTLVDAETISVPAIKELPLTLECRVMYVQKQDLAALSEEINQTMYPRDVDGTAVGANRDPHVTFFGEIVDAYIIED